MKLSEGDLVVVRGRYPRAVVGWEPGMDKLVGRVCEVHSVYVDDNGNVYAELALRRADAKRTAWTFRPYMFRKATTEDIRVDNFMRNVKGES